MSLGKIDHPNICFVVIVDEKQRRADQLLDYILRFDEISKTNTFKSTVVTSCVTKNSERANVACN
jgi:hypothetical protein